MTRLLTLIVILLASCSSVQPKNAASSPSVEVTGTVEKICLGCSEALLVSGGYVLWDVLTVRITSPENFSGTSISVEVLVEGTTPSSKYAQGKSIAFSAAAAAIKEHRVMLQPSDVHGG